MSRKKYYLSLLSMMLMGMLLPGCAIALDSVVVAKEDVVVIDESTVVVEGNSPVIVEDVVAVEEDIVVVEKNPVIQTRSTDAADTVVDHGAVTITPANTSQSIPAGYHNGAGTIAGDSNLVSGNIKRDIIIFGVAGDDNIVDSTSGDAITTEILLGKRAWVDGVEVTGSLAPQALSANSTTVNTGFYVETSLETVDNDLTADNIKAGTNIFGIDGSYTGIGGNIHDTSSGTATADNILTGKIAWVAGAEVTGTVPEGANVSGENGERSFLIPNGLYSGGETKVTANDSNLTAANIKKGITVFGVTGRYAFAGVAKTGQTRCTYHDGLTWQWDDNCSQPKHIPGQDGEIESGEGWTGQRFSTNNSDGTVTDNLTGLVWLANTNCKIFYSGDATGRNNRNWSDALRSVNLLANGHCALSDGSLAGNWRIPSVKEMQSLIAFVYEDPALTNDTGTGKWTTGDDSGFQDVQSDNYWTSTSYAGSAGYAWFMFLKYGVVHNAEKSVSYYVWPVRD